MMLKNKNIFFKGIIKLFLFGLPFLVSSLFLRNLMVLAIPLTAPITSPITSPIVSPTPLPTLLPITPPLGNRNPKIVTASLPNGAVGIRYETAVKAIDKDNDQLEMTIRGLPQELTPKCKSGGRGVVVCEISGVPTVAGKYLVRVFVSDNRGGFDFKVFKLIVRRSFKTL